MRHQVLTYAFPVKVPNKNFPKTREHICSYKHFVHIYYRKLTIFTLRADSGCIFCAYLKESFRELLKLC